MERGVAVLALLTLAACPRAGGPSYPAPSGSSYPAPSGSTSSSSGGATALTTRADALWADRADEATLQQSLAAYAEALAAGGPDRHVLTRLARGWYFWGDAFTTDKELQLARWGRSLEYGNQCIALNPAIATARANGQKDKDTVALAKPEDAPCLYWTATALSKWGKAKGIANTLAQLPTVKAYVTKVEALDPTYFHYGPARYWGAFYAALPSFAGQDLAKSAQQFEVSVGKAPYYLPTRVLRAEFLAVGTEDVAMFDRDLTFVLTADPDAEPDVGPENLKDQEKARALLARRAELFPKDVLATAGPAPDPASLRPAQRAQPDAIPADDADSGAIPAPY